MRQGDLQQVIAASQTSRPVHHEDSVDHEDSPARILVDTSDEEAHDDFVDTGHE